MKLLHDADDNLGAYRVATVFLVLGATCYFVPQTLAIEADSQDYLAGLSSLLTSASNQTLAGSILVVSLAGFALIAGSIFFRGIVASSRRLGRPAQAGDPAST